jgi:large repetitive protein
VTRILQPWTTLVFLSLSGGCLSNGSAGSPDVDRDGFDATEDCNDRDPDVRPDAEETCDGVDNDCDGHVDTDAQSGVFWPDEDGDGYGATSDTFSCQSAEGFVEDTSDCDDGDPDVHPGAAETCNSADDDCDGERDEDAGLVWHQDADGDGWGVEDLTVTTCIAPSGYVDDSGDCDDEDDHVNPGSAEICGDDVDNDCDELIDAEDTEVEVVTWYLDADFDGWGSDKTTVEDCSAPFGYTSVGGDCNDKVQAINPEALEECDGEDNDCDKQTDEDDAIDATLWYFDGDNDGYGIPGKTTEACNEPASYAPNDDDCDDGAFVSHPGATEICDDEDNDCDSSIDEDTTIVDWYRDGDGDTYGDPDDTLSDCEPIEGYVLNKDDCDDSDFSINPDGSEVCNGDDDDCNGSIDDDASDAVTCHTDADSDGYGTPAISYEGCSPPAECGTKTSDCDDSRADVNPGVPEICDGSDLDENCNLLADDDDPETDASSFATYFPDVDDDGYGDEASAGADLCDATELWETSDATDCDDAASGVNPGAQEVCDDLDTDEDCDDLADFDDPSVVGTITAYTDADFDGYGAIDDPGFAVCETTKGMATDATDCDDATSTTHPGAADVENAVDDDCDEWIDEGALVGGELVLTEIMPNPSDGDTGREWFEVLNVSKTLTLYLDGWAFSKDDGMKPETFFVSPEAGLWLGPGERALFCEDAAMFEAEAVSATCDYEYGTTDNGLADSIHGPATALSLDLHSLYDAMTFMVDALLVDVVVWDMDTWPFVEGQSHTLSESHLDAVSNDDPANWCTATELYDTGGAEADYGTPGIAGSCP